MISVHKYQWQKLYKYNWGKFLKGMNTLIKEV